MPNLRIGLVGRGSRTYELVLAGVAGFEPTNAGIKIPCLTAWRHPIDKKIWGGRQVSNLLPPEPQSGALPIELRPPYFLVRPERLEPPTHGLEGRCSILLSYGRISVTLQSLERVMGIGPTQPAWKASVLPLNYTRVDHLRTASTQCLKIISNR